MVAIAIYTLAVVLGIVLGGNIIVLSESGQNSLDDNANIKNEGSKISSGEFAVQFVAIGASLGTLFIVIMGPFYLYEWYIERKQKKLKEIYRGIKTPLFI